VVGRALIAGGDGASSLPAAIVFSLALVTVSLRSGWRPGRLRSVSVAAGVGGGLVLVVGPLLRGTVVDASGAGTRDLAAWTLVVSLVAVAEEVCFRGALWAVIKEEFGEYLALFATTIVFAVVHVPMYGWKAIPLDVGVGLGLGALRVWTGGVAAAATAHVLADLAGGLL
jgi:membrane protease YdiL (CAAX protease family)